jgi:hypothetical protein
MIDALAVAKALDVERSWVYAHKHALGAVRIGTGPRARVKFDPERIEEFKKRRMKPALPERPVPRFLDPAQRETRPSAAQRKRRKDTT